MIAIGASAGGLESLERLFDGLTPLNSTAFVVIQHLSPNYETMMDQLLSRHTTMNVSIVTDETNVEPNHVYVIPPKKEMLVRNGKLHLMDKDLGEIPHLPIDKFFKSMAEEYGSECAAIVLSGTGSDGSKGIASVRLMINNPHKAIDLEANGIRVVERVPHQVRARPENARYLQTKVEKMDHQMTVL